MASSAASSSAFTKRAASGKKRSNVPESVRSAFFDASMSWLLRLRVGSMGSEGTAELFVTAAGSAGFEASAAAFLFRKSEPRMMRGSSSAVWAKDASPRSCLRMSSRRPSKILSHSSLERLLAIRCTSCTDPNFPIQNPFYTLARIRTSVRRTFTDSRNPDMPHSGFHVATSREKGRREFLSPFSGYIAGESER